MLSNRVYNVIKFAVTIVMPALGTLYFSLATVWNLPYPEQVVGSLAAICTFFGVVMGYSTHQYNKSDARYDGVINVDTTNPDKDVFQLDLGMDPLDIPSKKEVTLRINSDV